MGYNIEISFNILKHKTVTNMKDVIRNIALEHGCNEIYDFYEMENETRYTPNRNHYIICVSFYNSCENYNSGVSNTNINTNTNIVRLLRFIEKVKKMRGYHIECIYTNDIPCNIIYASSYYLTTMDKQNAKDYINTNNNTNNNIKKIQKRDRSYSEDDIEIRKVVGVK